MRIVVINHLTLDGVMQARGRPDEDTSGGFSHGGWAIAGNDEVMRDALSARMGKPDGGLLLGRRPPLGVIPYTRPVPRCQDGRVASGGTTPDSSRVQGPSNGRGAEGGSVPATRRAGASNPGWMNPGAAARRRLRRYPDRGMLGGVCAGLAEHLGRDALAVRIVAAVALATGGIGIVAYVVAWILIPVAPGSERVRRSPAKWLKAALLVLVVLGVLVGLRLAGLTVGDWLVWALVLGLWGLALVWRRDAGPDALGVDARRHSSLGALRRARPMEAPRVLIGVLLVGAAAAALLHRLVVHDSLGKAAGTVALIGLMLALLVVPWFVRLGHSLASERAARIREQERAELAAHLHDSVLQTLALIQRRARDAREVAALARQQERELRRWLFERPQASSGERLKARLERAAAEVEERLRVPIEVVIVGDCPLDTRTDALVQAAREALTNAAKFAGDRRIDLYAEIAPDHVEAFVRDRGLGFDQTAIPDDRRGVRDSILARMERQGGHAFIRGVAGEGTEVELGVRITGGRVNARL